MTIVPVPGHGSTGEIDTAMSIRSLARYGITAIETLESRWIWTLQSANNWAAWKLRDSSIIPRSVRYRAPIEDGWLLKAGQVVTITDAKVHFSEQVCRIQSATLTPTGIELNLVIRQELGRDRAQR